MNEEQIIKEIDQLEILHWIRNDRLGPNAPEVIEIKEKIHSLNMQLLDFMCSE